MLSFTFLYASVWRRAIAFLIDAALILLAGIFILDPLISFLGLREATETLRRLPLSVVIVRVYGLWMILMVLLAWLYFAMQESSRNQATIGKRIMDIIVCSMDEERISFARASMRFWGKFISASLAGAGFILPFFDPKRRALHDKLARTQVLQPNAIMPERFQGQAANKYPTLRPES
jgi:uncharacterized RDD family membrane protein YckC